MDYKKKYDEALERAKRKIDAGFLASADLSYIFPELAESEDERIRKEIRDFLIDLECKEEWVTYLEKQKQTKQK